MTAADDQLDCEPTNSIDKDLVGNLLERETEIKTKVSNAMIGLSM